jgi:hypothetical protein
MDQNEAYSLCQQHMYRYVIVQMSDGSSHDGIVVSVDEQHLHLAVPMGDADGEQTRAFVSFGYPGYGGFGGYGGYPYGGFHGYGYPGYGYPGYGYPGYGYPRRRFFRRSLPLGGLLALSLLPYF